MLEAPGIDLVLGLTPVDSIKTPSNCPHCVPQDRVRGRVESIIKGFIQLQHNNLKWRLPVPGHALMKGGYRYTGVPPIASRIVIASGQLSTDSFGAG